MTAQIATSADRQTTASPTFEDRSSLRTAVKRSTWYGMTERCLRRAGHVVVALPPATWMLVDLGIVLVGVSVAYAVFPPPEFLSTPHIALWQAMAIFAFSVAMASMVFGLYERETILSRSRILARMLLTTGTATVVVYTLIYVIMYSTVSRRITALVMFELLVGSVGIRLFACWAVTKVRRGLLVVGRRTLFESFEQAQAQGLLPEYRLVGYADTQEGSAGSMCDPYYCGRIEDQIPKLGENGILDIVVAADATRDPRLMNWLIPSLQGGCRVTNEAIFYEKATGQILVDEITPDWFISADLKVHCDRQASFKWVLDLGTAVVGLLLSAPLWPLIALAIKLCDRGPVFYTQERVGQNGLVFTLYKFRTMRTDAEQGHSIWSSPGDPRVTRVGRWLRRTRLDELPQLYNVLIGNMSIIGPRPERPDLVGQLCEKVPYYTERHLIKPGLTGWAQISFRYGSSVEDAKRKLQFDLYYLKHMSFELDMIILLRTAGTFLRGAC